MYRNYSDPSDSFDTHAAERDAIDAAAESAHDFDAMSWEAQEDFLQAQRDAFALATYKTALAAYQALDGFDRFEACAPVAPVSMHVALTANGVSVRLKAVA
jgi:hypothetical protein